MDASPVVQTSFASAVEDEVADFISRVYVDNRLRLRAVPKGASFAAQVGETAILAADRISATLDYSIEVEPLDYLMFPLIDRGVVRIARGREETVLRPGQCMALPLGVAQHMATFNFGVRIVRIPVVAVAAVAEETTGIAASEVRFDGGEPVSDAMGRYWRAVTGLVNGALLADPSPMSNSLVAQEMARMVAVGALQTFANTSVQPDRVRPAGQVAPAALRRAVAYVDSHADQPVTVADVADAAGIGVRALQHAFRRHRDTTPLGYLRTVRLERAHRELQAADPTTGATVAAVAARWGYLKADRFAAAYRQAYGVLPSHTLRS